MSRLGDSQRTHRIAIEYALQGKEKALTAMIRAFSLRGKGLLKGSSLLAIHLANGPAHIGRTIENSFAEIAECFKHILARSQLPSMVNKIVLVCRILNSSKVLLDF